MKHLYVCVKCMKPMVDEPEAIVHQNFPETGMTNTEIILCESCLSDVKNDLEKVYRQNSSKVEIPQSPLMYPTEPNSQGFKGF